jgi:hypothetical protein
MPVGATADWLMHLSCISAACIFAACISAACYNTTTADEEQDNQEVAGALIDALGECNALELLVERMSKMNEAVDEEAAAVNHGLAIIEHAVEVRKGASWGQWR